MKRYQPVRRLLPLVFLPDSPLVAQTRARLRTWFNYGGADCCRQCGGRGITLVGVDLEGRIETVCLSHPGDGFAPEVIIAVVGTRAQLAIYGAHLAAQAKASRAEHRRVLRDDRRMTS